MSQFLGNSNFDFSEVLDISDLDYDGLHIPTERVGQIVGNYKDDTQRKTKGFDEDSTEDVPVVLPRYKVRICGESDGVDDEDLPWAYPPYKSSGLGPGESFEDELAPNTFVAVDEDKDGNLYIAKVYPNTKESLQQAQGACTAKSGFLPGRTVDILHETWNNESIFGTEIIGTWLPTLGDKKQDKDAKPGAEFDRPCPTDKDKGGMSKINTTISNLIEQVEDLQDDIQGIQDAVEDASQVIADGITWLVQEIRKWILSKTSTIINQLTNIAPLASRFAINDATNRALQIISCLFLRMLLNLAKMIRDALMSFVRRIVNMSACVLETFLSNFIGQLVGQLTAAINRALSAVSSLLGSVISFGNEILSFIESLFDFLTCRDLYEQQCAEAKKWNLLRGANNPPITLDIASIFRSAQNVSANFQAVANIPSDVSSTNFTFDPGGALDDALTNCNVDSILCGPPRITFFGGDGGGATGNAVISSAGQLLGVDIVLPGEYVTPPLVSIDTDCGNGNGATAIAGIGTTTAFIGIGTTMATGVGPGIGTTVAQGVGPTGIATVGVGVTVGIVTGVTQVVIPNTGYGYTSHPSGSRGGMGRTWAGRCQTIVKRANATWDTPHSEGDVVCLGYGDMVQFPGGSPITIDCSFNADTIPGAIVTGDNPCYADMTTFGNGGGNDNDDTATNIGWTPKSMIGFDDSAGTQAGVAPVQFLVTTGSMFENNITIEGLLNVTGPEQGPPGSGTFLPGIGWDNKIQLRRTINVEVQVGQVYTVRVRNTDGRSWTGTRIRFNQVAGRNHRLEVEDHTDYDWTDIRCTASIGQFYDIENRADGTAVCKFRVAPAENLPNVFGYILDYPYARSLGFSDQDIRYYLAGVDGNSGYYTSVLGNRLGPIMQTKIDDPEWGKLPATFLSIPGTTSNSNNSAGVFDLTTSMASARALGFTDQDIRYYLTNRYFGRIGPGVQALLDDPNWAPLANFSVCFTAPGCGDDLGDLTGALRYPVIPVCGDPVPLGPGVGYSCADDTVSIIPDRGATAEIAECRDGGIIRIRITNRGGPFDEMPKIVINSETGHGAEFLGTLDFLRPEDVEMPEGTVPLQVIDCVGKVFE